MKKHKLYSLIAILLAVFVYGYKFFLERQEQQVHVELGEEVKEYTNEYFLPTSTTGQIIHHKGFSLSYNEAYEQAEWVAYELKKSQLVNRDIKRPYFELDKAVSTGSADWRNYKNSGYDRGHLCPAADREFDEALYTETFLTSNIAPQVNEFNAGIWNRLEQKVRYWAAKYDGVYVVTGGILESSLTSIGEEQVAVPKHFYKIVLDYNKGDAKMIAFLMPNASEKKSLYSYIVSVDYIENLTGIDFFPELDDTLENKLEATSKGSGWKF